MAKIQAVWALDIGQAAVKALKLVPGETADQVLAEAFDYIEYPKILSQPDADPEQLVREALETFLERNELKGCKVAIGVPGQAGLVKFIKLPPVEKKRIPDIVKFEAKQQIPFALEEVVWAYQQIGDEDEEGGDDDFTMAEVGLFAMKRDQINRAILPLKMAGIEVDIVQMGPIALYNFITFDQLKGSETKDSIVLLDIGADNTDLIITDGTRIWQRNVPIGGNHFTRALTKELKLTFAKAEHLKRNATKAPDPRSIFTAMRGVFNDFASEVNRSIGFYASVNRSAKIAKVIGLGNGFKLPGLQKFLQQNLNQEVEKLEGFVKMTGDEVKASPQFLENIPSFAVAYGLAIQGLGKSGLRTNLLPPEIEQVRLIRAKKPWVLAASALLMLGFSGLFLGDYRVLAKVSTEPFKSAVARAKSTTDRGGQFKTEYEAAKGEWTATFNEGKSLVADSTDRGMWPEFLKTINRYIPDPVVDYKLDPDKPANQDRLDKLRVHVDALKPVWRQDVGAEWFTLDSNPAYMKNLMHAYDRANPPSGEGWVVQIVCHHYNPYPTADELRLPEGQRTAYGPFQFITQKILPRFMAPSLRLYGVHHVALAWMTSDKEWTNEKSSATNGLAKNTVPILARATAPVSAEGGSSSGSGSMGMMGMGGGSSSSSNSSMSAEMGMMGSMMAAMGGRPPGTAEASKKDIVTLTRTDFLLQFVWQPPKPEDVPKTDEERKAKLEEITKQLIEAQSNNPAVAIKEAEIEQASLKKSQELTTELMKGESAPVAIPGARGAVAPPPTAPTAAPAAPPATPK